MSTLPHTHSLAPAPLKLVAARIAESWKRLVSRDLSRPALNDRVLYRLSTLSDRDLSDIGLSRSERGPSRERRRHAFPDRAPGRTASGAPRPLPVLKDEGRRRGTGLR